MKKKIFFFRKPVQEYFFIYLNRQNPDYIDEKLIDIDL